MKISLLLIAALLVFLLAITMAAFAQDKPPHHEQIIIADTATVSESTDTEPHGVFERMREIQIDGSGFVSGKIKLTSTLGNEVGGNGIMPFTSSIKKGDRLKVNITIEKVTP